jgi:4-alpha-glucanotransferase
MPMQESASPVLDARRAGVLLHVTSLPAAVEFDQHAVSDSEHSVKEAPTEEMLGDFGQATEMVDFLVAAGMSVWQILPLGPTHKDLSPYLCTSSHAGNPLLIDLQWLRDVGWLEDELNWCMFSSVSEYRLACLRQAFKEFSALPTDAYHLAYNEFIAAHASWLTDFAVFTALGRATQGAAWMDWEPSLRDRDAHALSRVHQTMAVEIDQIKFEQYIFYAQWRSVKKYAHSKGVLIFGDMPLYVAQDSAEVWVNRQYFCVDDHGDAAVVAGVPPDYFSATGQKWGNPVYDWQRLQADGFQWWIKRFSSQLELYDLLRIDHFRGFEACWEIAAGADSAVDGRWQPTPGFELLQTLHNSFGHLPFVAEDLGFITPEVYQLRDAFHLPGMTVTQFAFDGSETNPYLLSHHEENSVAYTGTHDNDTSVAWYQSLSPSLQNRVSAELNRPEMAMPWSLIDYTLASIAKLVMIPMQDLLSLGSGHRLNTPGTVGKNWRWQFSWQQVSDDLPGRVRGMVADHRRLVE